MGDVRGSDGKWQFALAEDPRVALVRITSFGDHTAEELSQVLDQLVSAGVKGVVLDLRDNAGGALDAAVAVCEPAAARRKAGGGDCAAAIRRQHRRVRPRKSEKRFLTLPLAVIVNQNSASAAEIVAACLQDHGRAVVVGQRTYGKGTVQQYCRWSRARAC